MPWTQVMPGLFLSIPNWPHVPSRTYYRMRFETFKKHVDPAAYDVVHAFVWEQAPHHFLMLSGPVGRGKTHLSMAAVWDWLEFRLGWQHGADSHAYYYMAEDILDSIRGMSFADHKLFLSVLESAGLLVIDGLGEYYDKGDDVRLSWASTQLHRIIDHRYSNGLRTIIATNCGPDQLPGRIADRISEGQIVVMRSHESYRAKLARARRQ